MLFPNYVFINHLDEIKLEFSKSKRNLERENNYIRGLELDKKNQWLLLCYMNRVVEIYWFHVENQDSETKLTTKFSCQYAITLLCFYSMIKNKSDQLGWSWII